MRGIQLPPLRFDGGIGPHNPSGMEFTQPRGTEALTLARDTSILWHPFYDEEVEPPIIVAPYHCSAPSLSIS